jgi:organic radical activating enzyme
LALILATVSPGEPEIFAALQGEGPSAGWPCAFVRLSRCNLACEWCDTAYTWRFAGDNRPHRDGITFDRDANQVTLAEAEVAARIAALGKARLVITGGEPLLQAPALARMIAHLPKMRIEVETNGTVIPTPALDALIDQYNVSPKLTHSGNPRELALVSSALAHFAGDQRACFKFVIAEPEDVDEVRAIAAEYAIPPARILLMPEGRDSATLRARAVWLSEICSIDEFRYSDRLHIHLHGDTRGT